MVWPADRTFSREENGKSIDFHVPRVRFYVDTEIRSEYVVCIHAYRNDTALSFAKFSKYFYKRFDDAEIFYVSNGKANVITSDVAKANRIASDTELNSRYMVFIPSDACEVKGVCPIPTDYTEQEVFMYGLPKNTVQYGEIPSHCKITEVRRMQRKANDNSRYDINAVSVCFSGHSLPSHVYLDGVNYPVKPFRESVIQCRKCWHFNHTSKVCSRSRATCKNCGLAHDLVGHCQYPPSCINCKGNHAASSNMCPIFQKILKEKVDKAEKIKPKQIFQCGNPNFAEGPQINDYNFPPLPTPKGKRQFVPTTTTNNTVRAKRVRVEENQEQGVAASVDTSLFSSPLSVSDLNTNSISNHASAAPGIEEQDRPNYTLNNLNILDTNHKTQPYNSDPINGIPMHNNSDTNQNTLLYNSDSVDSIPIPETEVEVTTDT